MTRLRSLATGVAIGLVAVVGLAPATAVAAAPHWSLQHTTIPDGAVSTFPLAVSCPNGRSCIAMGYYNVQPSAQQIDQVAFAERWDGRRWIVSNVPVPASAGVLSELTSISCPTATNCTAVGEYLGNVFDTPTPLPLVEHWDGQTWSRQTAPYPTSGVTAAPLTGVSCPSPGSCTAVGHYDLPSGLREPLVETWDGTAWTMAPGGSPEFSEELNGVDCLRGGCVAVGDQSRPLPLTLAERSTGATWSVQTTPNPSDGSFSYELGSVSCHTMASCVAVGTAPSNLSGGLSSNVVEHWDGSAWTLQTVPVPVGGASFNFLASVSCPALRSCVAVGSAGSSRDNWILRWNGTIWKLQSSTAPSSLPGHGAVLSGVSCSGENACMAVGYYAGENFDELPYAERLAPASATAGGERGQSSSVTRGA